MSGGREEVYPGWGSGWVPGGYTGYYPPTDPAEASLRLIYRILGYNGSYGRLTGISSNILRSEISGIWVLDLDLGSGIWDLDLDLGSGTWIWPWTGPEIDLRESHILDIPV